MRSKPLLLLLLATLLMLPAVVVADGTEALGPPTIGIASGSGIVVAGTGLVTTGSGTISLDVPGEVAQALLYWEGQYTSEAAHHTIEVNNNTVTGTLIGGPTEFFRHAGAPVYSSAYRADITGLVGTGPNTLTVSGLNFDFANNGAGLLVIYDDGSDATIDIRDGLDLAFCGFASTLNTTVKQVYTFSSSPEPRDATLSMFFSSVSGEISSVDGRYGPLRPSVVRIWVNGWETSLVNALDSWDGDEWDTLVHGFTVPAGATEVAVQAFSEDAANPGKCRVLDPERPASFAWITSALAIHEPPPPPPPGCTRTPGYWKTHSEHGPAPYDSTWAQLPNGADTLFFLSGQTYHQVLWTPPQGGNAYYILAQAYIAAELNFLAGADSSAVWEEFQQAKSLFETYTPAEVGAWRGNRGERPLFLSLAETLDKYNNGIIGPGHCP